MFKPNIHLVVVQSELQRLQECASRIEIDTKKQSKKRVLFLPAPVRSHIIPTLHIAGLLARDYSITYAVTSSILAELVSKNGFTPVLTSAWQPHETLEWEQIRFWSTIYTLITNKQYHHRKQELDNLLVQIKPDYIIIDVFNSNDFLALYHHRNEVQLLFYNPMMATFQVSSLQTMPIANIDVKSSSIHNHKKFSLRNLLKNPHAELYEAVLRYQSERLLQLVGLAKEHSPIKLTDSNIRLFSNVQELVLAPLEFELSPAVKKPHQHYLGLGIQEARTDTELDAEFEQQWPVLLARKRAGQRIIYCSFGTYYTGSFKILFDFITKLLKGIDTMPNVQLVCSVNNLVIETLQVQQALLPNTHFFRRVPQLMVLKDADVYITHGGLGSVKEGIYYGVPMLVCPLDLFNDQQGNGMKIEYHELGLQGNFRCESASSIRDKLSQLLNETAFHTNLERFRQTCAMRYSDENVRDKLIQILNNNAL